MLSTVIVLGMWTAIHCLLSGFGRSVDGSRIKRFHITFVPIIGLATKVITSSDSARFGPINSSQFTKASRVFLLRLARRFFG